MALRDILIHPDSRLRTVTDPVTEIDDELKKLAGDMLETMYAAPGIGLAAPQVGILKRMLVMDCIKDEEAKPQPMVLINPAVVWSSEDESTYEEGCLSIPEQYENVSRPAEVEVTLGDLRPARDRPSERQALHRLSETVEAADDYSQDAEAEARKGPRLKWRCARSFPGPTNGCAPPPNR